MAWQFHVAEQDAGAVQAFRHGQALAETGTFRLHGLDPLGEYVVKDTEANVTRLVNGRQLVEEGLAIAIAIRPGAALVTYRKR